MLVSLAIVSTIVTMVYGSYAATSRSLDVYGSRMACSERAHLVLRMMARQIRCAYMPPAVARSTETDADRKNPPAESITTFRAEPRGLRGDILNFTTTGGFGLGLDSPVGISRVAYRYDESHAALLIRCEPGVYGPDSLRETVAWRPALSGVTEIELAFHDGRQWQPRWDSRQAGRLPQAVQIALTLADQNGRTHRYATTVPIICRTAPQTRATRTPVEQP
jgi:type II secretory pathway component PulJ